MTITETITKTCAQCYSEFTVHCTTRGLKRTCCSPQCAKKYNGARNKGRTHSDEYKHQLSVLNTGSGNPFFGRHHTEEMKQGLRQQRIGRKLGRENPNWRGGIKHRPDGYVRLSSNDKYQHRIALETMLGRPLQSDEFVHHIDGDNTNNCVSNLQIMTNSEHRKLHCCYQKRNSKGVFVT